MKKLLLLLGLFLTTNAHAAVISLNSISNDSTASTFNSNFTTIGNVINGNIEGSSDGGSTVANLKADSVFQINMADDANPSTFAAELFGIGSDSVSGGTLTQAAVVESGCIPADDTDLTSDISACVAYVNGYRVSKSSTANTYTASRDCYVDLSQSGVYTTTCVTNGATQPSVAANSVRLAKVVTNGTEITTITSVYTTRVPGLIIPSDYRDGLIVSRDSTTVISISPGHAEINNSLVTKTTTTQLNVGTAGDWAGGSSLRAVNTFGYVGIDTSGNLKLHTTAPAYEDYAVSSADGKKRYSTWSSTVHRILGWFYMDGSGSGLVQVASNIKEVGIPNIVQSSDVSSVAISSAGTYNTISRMPFYNSGGKVLLTSVISGDVSTGMGAAINQLDGSTEITNSYNGLYYNQGTALTPLTVSPVLQENVSQASRTYSIQAQTTSAGTFTVRGRRHIIEEQ